MSKKLFICLFLFINVIFLFTKIYQHNLLIKLNYEKQRAENKINFLKQKKNDLVVKALALKDYNKIKKFAEEKLGMQPLRLSQVITVSGMS